MSVQTKASETILQSMGVLSEVLMESHVQFHKTGDRQFLLNFRDAHIGLMELGLLWSALPYSAAKSIGDAGVR